MPTFNSITRGLLEKALINDGYLTSFAMDYFPAASLQFSNAMDRQAKVNLLFTHGKVEHLLKCLEEAYPEVVKGYDLLGLLRSEHNDDAKISAFLDKHFPQPGAEPIAAEALALRIEALRRRTPLYQILPYLFSSEDEIEPGTRPRWLWVKRGGAVTAAISLLTLGWVNFPRETSKAPPPTGRELRWRPNMISITVSASAQLETELKGGSGTKAGGVVSSGSGRRSYTLAMAVTEVTLAQYKAVLDEDPTLLWRQVKNHHALSPCPAPPRGNDIPVYCVDFYDAARYCNTLSTKENLVPCYVVDGDTVQWPSGYRCPGYRLPTQAEWDLAARGNDTRHGSRYAGGDTPELLGWYALNSHDEVQPVGGLQPNQLGLYDMSGNVMEWVWDSPGSARPRSGLVELTGLAAGKSRVLRGGSFKSSAKTMLLSNQAADAPSNRVSDVGFRIARTL